MTNVAHVLSQLLEADEDDFDLKDATALPPTAGKTSVKRFGRWKLVDMEDFTFLISYLTPVAYLDKASGSYYETKKHWSPTTKRHIDEWKGMIHKSPEHQANPEYKREGYVSYPTFHRVRQDNISQLFLDLMKSMEVTPREKKRMYHVDPQMRQGNDANVPWNSSHLKHKNTGKQGLPLPLSFGGVTHGGDELKPFFQDIEIAEPEFYDWQQSERRNQEPHEDE